MGVRGPAARLLPSAPVSTPRNGAATGPQPSGADPAPAATPPAGKPGGGPAGKPAARKGAGGKAGAAKRPPAAKPNAKPGGKAGARPGAAGGKAGAKGGKGRVVPPPPGPGLVVGQVPVLARVAGALALAGAVLRFVAAIPALATSGGQDLGGLQNGWDLVPPLPILLVVGAAGLAVLRARLPRLGMAVLLSAGTLAAGELLRTLALFDTGRRTTVDLPLGIATSAVYDPGAGLVLLAVAYGLLVAAALAAGVAWSTTVMEDAGSFDRLRPRVATWGLIVGSLAALVFGTAPYLSAAGLPAVPVTERSGLDLLGGLVLTLGTAVWAVVAATLRPRLAVAGAYAGLAAVLAADALATLLLVIRSPAADTGFGTVGRLLAVVAVTALAVAVPPVRGISRARR